MQFPDNLNLKPMNVLKIAGLILVAIILLTLFFRLVGSSFNSITDRTSTSGLMQKSMPAYYDASEAYGEAEGMEYDGKTGDVSNLSVRNVISQTVPPINGNAAVGDNTEEFEVTEYNARIETRNLKNDCNKILELKIRNDVIFENANGSEKSCNYYFKVKRNSADEVLKTIKDLNPKELDENTYTIKKLVDDYTSEVDILKKKMVSIEETLSGAVNAYDEIALLATKTQNAESLAKIIDSKVNIIERLTQERININAQLERLDRAKAEQLDKLDYIYFNVYIYENKFIDGQSFKDSWKSAIKAFMRDINMIAQDISINLVAMLFFALQYILYFFIILVVVKYVWKAAKKVWLK